MNSNAPVYKMAVCGFALAAIKAIHYGFCTCTLTNFMKLLLYIRTSSQAIPLNFLVPLDFLFSLLHYIEQVLKLLKFQIKIFYIGTSRVSKSRCSK